MDEKTAQLLKTALNIVYYYRNNPALRTQINQVYLREPFKDYYDYPFASYLRILTTFSPNYKRYFKQYGLRRIPEYLATCYNDQTEFTRLRSFLTGQTPLKPPRPPLPLTDQASAGQSAASKLLDEWKKHQVKEEQKRKAAYLLAEKIKRYGQKMVTPEGQEELIKGQFLTKKERQQGLQVKQEEINDILKAGLVRAWDAPPNPNLPNYPTMQARQKAIFDTAAKLIEDKVITKATLANVRLSREETKHWQEVSRYKPARSKRTTTFKLPSLASIPTSPLPVIKLPPLNLPVKTVSGFGQKASQAVKRFIPVGLTNRPVTAMPVSSRQTSEPLEPNQQERQLVDNSISDNPLRTQPSTSILQGDNNPAPPSTSNRRVGIPRLPIRPRLPIGGAQAGARLALGVGRFALLGNPLSWLIGIFALLIVLPILFALLETTATCPPFQPRCGGASSVAAGSILEIKKSGPPQVGKNDQITYQIAVSYSGPGSADIEITDKIPDQTEFIAASDGGVNNAGVATWSIDNLTSGSSKQVSLTIQPKAEIVVTNIAQAKVTNTTTPSPTPGSSAPPIVRSSDFDTLMRDQGRNTLVLGDENSFTTHVLGNGSSLGLSGKESNIRQIYKIAVTKNVNPLAVLTLWGEEAAFLFRGQRIGTSIIIRFEFGCDVTLERFNGFDNQVHCAVNTLNNEMAAFEKNKGADGTFRRPSHIGRTCIYNDAFLYAAEVYGPICTASDSNENFRPNFAKLYNKLLGS